MKGKLSVVVAQIRFSYWFLPTLMALVAAGLAFGAVALDSWLGDGWLSDLGWLSVNDPEGARTLLGTIAGSMITVAGVTFSITVAAVANATNNVGPRLVTSFLKDRANQATLGVFIATFVYCLLVLRTVVSQGEGIAAFVPQVALLIALLLALASTGVLIYFIHHIPQSVHVEHLVAGVAHELLDIIGHLFPRYVGEGVEPPKGVALGEENFSAAHRVPARGFGYVQQIDAEHLLRIARHEDLVIRIECPPGSFVSNSTTLVSVLAARPPDDGLIDRINATFTWDDRRSPTQDVMFLVSQLVQIAGRALSPGINDPLTAINCMDWLSSALIELAQRETPSPFRADDEGKLRVVAVPREFPDFVEASFGALRGYICSDRNASLHALEVLAHVAPELRTAAQRECLREQAAAYMEACTRLLEDRYDLERLKAIFARIDACCSAQSGTVLKRDHG